MNMNATYEVRSQNIVNFQRNAIPLYIIISITLFPVQQMQSNFKPSCKIGKGLIKVPQNKF